MSDAGAGGRSVGVVASDQVGRRVVSPALVGRDDELARVLSVAAAPPAVVVVEGEAGVGKTRLVAELLSRPELARHRRLVGRCQPIRESFPLGPMIEALRDIGGELTGVRLGQVAGALRPLLPELADSLPVAPDGLDDRQAERHRVFRAIGEILTAVGTQSGPVLLVLEDLHWADAQTIDFMTYWLSRPTAEVAVVLTYRSEDVDAEVAALTARLPAAIGHGHVVLEPLDPDGTAALTAAILGVEGVSAGFARYLWERTDGLPLAVEEVLALARARGAVVRHGDRWERKPLEQLDVPSGIRDPTLQRVVRLPSPAQQIVAAAAVLQTAVPLAVLLETAGQAGDSGGAVLAVERALESGLLVENGDAIGFRHVLPAEAVRESLSVPRRQELHSRAAAALGRAPAPPLGRVAHHLRRAGDNDAWVDAAEAAADQAVRLAHEEEATRLLLEVLDRAQLAPSRRSGLAIKLGWAALETLRAPAVIETLSGALELSTSPPQRAELQYLLSSAINKTGGDVERQRDLLLAALPHLDTRPALRVRAMTSLAIVTPADVPIAEDITWLRRALALVGQVDDPQLEALVLGDAGSILVVTGDRACRDVADRLLRLTAEVPRRRREALACYSIGLAACYAGQVRLAERFLNLAVQAPAAAENRRIEVLARSAMALLRLIQGSWRDLSEDVERLRSALDETIQGHLEIDIVSGGLALARGDLEQAADRFDAATALAIRIGAHEVTPVVAAYSAQVAAARGDMRAALRSIDVLMASLRTKEVWPPVCWGLPSAVDVLVASGKHNLARQLLLRAEAALEGLDAPLAPAALTCARGVLSGSAEMLVRSGGLYDAAPAPYEAARAYERAAGVLFDSGDRAEAETHLRRALATYEALDATRDHDRVTRLARSHSVRVSSRRRGQPRVRYDAELSPRERQVADLVATGRTNKQVAAELFVSVKTVDKHLASAMRKLGVPSRTALALRLGGAGAARDG